MRDMDKALIEQGKIELVELFDSISEEARKEKLAVPPINKILYWWTRKPLIVSRAISLLSILPNNTQASDVKRLLYLNSGKRAYTYNVDLSLLNRSIEPSKIKVLDPFAGAGNLIFEAKRFGFDCYAIDYNPVAYLIEKAVLVYPSKYDRLADDVDYYGKRLIDAVKKELGYLYDRDRRKALAYLYSWCIRCPYCKQRIPLMNHSWFANTEKKRIGIRVKPREDKGFDVELVYNMSEEEGESYTQKGGKAICISCKSGIDYDHLTNDIANNKDYEMIGVVVKGNNGKDYELATKEDKDLFLKAKDRLEKEWDYFESEGLIPYESIRAAHRRENLLWHYGFTQWYQYFNPRQLLLMLTILKNIRIIAKEIEDKHGKDYAKVIVTYLAFMLCKHIDFNSIGIGWIVTNEQISHTLSMRRPSIIYNFAETNPFEKTSGSLQGMLKDIVDAIKFASNNRHNANVRLGSALHLPYKDQEFDLIITDPPYLDDVQYGEISEFFYVWLYRALKDYYPELPARVPLDEDITVSWGRFGNKKAAFNFYEKALKQAFKEMYRVLKDDGLAVIFFAHSSNEAWYLLLDILREAKMQVTLSYAVHTESTQNVLARGKTTFMSSIVIACRKISRDREAYFEDLIPQIEDKIEELLRDIKTDKLLTLPITDLLIMIYGEVLEVATAYTRLKSYSKDTNLTFEDIIDYAREYMMKALVKKLVDRDISDIGAEAAVYLLGKVFYNGVLEADELSKIIKIYNIDPEKKGMAKNEKGIIKLLPFTSIEKKRLEEVDANNVYQQLMYIEQLAYEEGASKVKNIISYSSFRVNELKSIISLLIKHYNLVKNKGIELNKEDEKEFDQLRAIADVLGLRIDEAVNRIDDYVNDKL